VVAEQRVDLASRHARAAKYRAKLGNWRSVCGGYFLLADLYRVQQRHGHVELGCVCFFRHQEPVHFFFPFCWSFLALGTRALFLIVFSIFLFLLPPPSRCFF